MIMPSRPRRVGGCARPTVIVGTHLVASVGGPRASWSPRPSCSPTSVGSTQLRFSPGVTTGPMRLRRRRHERRHDPAPRVDADQRGNRPCGWTGLDWRQGDVSPLSSARGSPQPSRSNARCAPRTVGEGDARRAIPGPGSASALGEVTFRRTATIMGVAVIEGSPARGRAGRHRGEESWRFDLVERLGCPSGRNASFEDGRVAGRSRVSTDRCSVGPGGSIVGGTIRGRAPGFRRTADHRPSVPHSFGRSSAMEQTIAALARSRRGAGCSTLLVTGQPGMGQDPG